MSQLASLDRPIDAPALLWGGDPGRPQVTEVEIARPPRTLTPAPPTADVVLVRHQLRDFPHHQYWENGAAVATRSLRARETIFHDLRQSPRVLLDQPYHALHFALPWSVFDEIADETSNEHFGELVYEPGVGLIDATIEHLASAMLAQLRVGAGRNRLFVEQLTHTLATHIAHTYGRLRPKTQVKKGGLSPRQLDRVQEILRANLHVNLSLEVLARECRLSTRHFTRAFRASTGSSPHRWLVDARLEVAKTLLKAGSAPISEIALICGFSDQSHLTRSFSRAFGESPGAWARNKG